MKYLMITVLLFLCNDLAAQETKAEFDGHKWEAPYQLPIPEKWNIERFLIPISFAPSISYKGVEDIRFTPGWANVKSEEYWTYAFLWWLDGPVMMDDKIIADNLKAYYSGLFEVNREGYKVPKEMKSAVKTSFREVQAAPGDLKTFNGTIEMLDYMQQKPVTLYCIAHLRSCTAENKTVLFYQLSPQSYSHKNWTSLNQLWAEFKCKK